MSELDRQVDDHLAAARGVREELLPQVERGARLIAAALGAGHTLFTFGNGGSAADAQHFAAELLGRFRVERGPLPAVALSTDSSALTAIANDYAFEEVFARQLAALARPGDVAFGITTSGSSPNVLRGLEVARSRGASTVALTGRIGEMGAAADEVIAVPGNATARIQEMHLLVIHLLCDELDRLIGLSEEGVR